MAETDSVIPSDDTIFDDYQALLAGLRAEERPTRDEEIAGLSMLITMAPNLDLHRNGLSKAGLRPDAVGHVLAGFRHCLWSRLSYLTEPDPATLPAMDNVVPLRRGTNARKPKKP